MGIIDDIKGLYAQSETVAKYVLINVGVFLALKIVLFVLWAAHLSHIDPFLWLALPSDPQEFITRPWTLISYMFLHEGFWHLLVNMLWLHFGGRILHDLMGSKKFVKTYWMGGFLGGLLFILAFNFIPALQGTYPPLLGASAAVFSVFIAITTYAPEYEVGLPFIGAVKLKWIALIFIILSLPNNNGNMGGHIAHAGGALWGYLWASQLKKGRDIGAWFDTIADQVSTFSFKRKEVKFKVHRNTDSRVPVDYNEVKVEKQKEIDRILDKISKNGYESLTSKEKEILFKASDKG